MSQPHVTTPAWKLHIQHLHLQDGLRPTTTMVFDPEASCCSVAAARWLVSKPAQPTSGSPWKRNPVAINPFFKSSLMKVIQAEQTLTWNASSLRGRCVRERSQAAAGVTTSMITRQELVNNANEDQRERFTRPQMGQVGEKLLNPSVAGLGGRQTCKFTYWDNLSPFSWWKKWQLLSS